MQMSPHVLNSSKFDERQAVEAIADRLRDQRSRLQIGCSPPYHRITSHNPVGAIVDRLRDQRSRLQIECSPPYPYATACSTL